MKYLPIEKCLGSAKNSVYKLAIMVAKRARDLAEGEKTLAASFDQDKPLKAAFEEVINGNLKVK